MQTMAINRRALLRFMNTDLGSGHHTAVAAMLGEPLAVGLLLHYLTGKGLKATCVSTKVTQGTKAGARLDAWIATEDQTVRTLYQTEIKMWAGNALGGLRLSDDADEAVLAAGAARQWNRIWEATQEMFIAPSVAKVLIPMKRPAGYEDWPCEPLACFWWLMRSQPEDGPWFTLDVGMTAKSPFGRVHIFSLTAYLLTLEDETLHLHLPLLRDRLQLIGGLFGSSEQHWTDVFRP